MTTTQRLMRIAFDLIEINAPEPRVITMHRHVYDRVLKRLESDLRPYLAGGAIPVNPGWFLAEQIPEKGEFKFCGVIWRAV